MVIERERENVGVYFVDVESTESIQWGPGRINFLLWVPIFWSVFVINEN